MAAPFRVRTKCEHLNYTTVITHRNLCDGIMNVNAALIPDKSRKPSNLPYMDVRSKRSAMKTTFILHRHKFCSHHLRYVLFMLHLYALTEPNIHRFYTPRSIVLHAKPSVPEARTFSSNIRPTQLIS